MASNTPSSVAGVFLFFVFNDTATTEIYTLSLHDALPISAGGARRLEHGHGPDERLGPAGGGRPPAGARGHRPDRPVAPRTQPGRGVPVPDRASGGARAHRQRGDRRMSTFALTAPLRPHVGVGPSIRQALVLTRRSLLRIKTNPEELIGLTLMPVMFLVLFTYVFGGAIAGSPGAYLQYALPGIVVQGVFFSTMYTGYGLHTDIKVGIFDRFRSLPVARSAPLIGQVLGDLARYAIGIAITLGAGVAFGFRIHTGPLQTLAAFGALVAAAFAFSWGYTLLGLVARSAVVIQA